MIVTGQQAPDRDWHATYSGSGIHRLLAGCYGQVRLARTVPPAPPTIWQAEGTEAHRQLEQRIKTEGAPAGEHDASTQHVIDYLRSVGAFGPDAVLMSERRVTFPQTIVPPMEASGTLDCIAVVKRFGRTVLYVIDYKHGAGEFVSEEENAQLMFYAAAALDSINVNIDEVALVIVQPNCSVGEPVREARVSMDQLVEFTVDVRDAIDRSERLHAPLKAGAWCKFCAAGPACTTRESTALAVMTGKPESEVREWAPTALTPPAEIDLPRLGFILQHADAARKWLKDVEDYAERRALAGEIEIPGMKIVESPPRRQWLANMGEVYAGLAELLGLEPGDLATMDCLMPRKLIGLSEADNRLKLKAGTDKKARAAIMDAASALSVKDTSGALSLVPLHDKRPPVNRAAGHFAGVVIAPPEGQQL